MGTTLIAGCSEADGPPPRRTAAISTYVALGDSYAAAPYVPVTDLADGCFRSSGNYPSITAERLGAELTDVTCSGADTADLTERQVVALGRGRVPAQIEAVAPDTDLVTVTIGGNDENLFATLVQRCTALADEPGTPCRDELTADYGARVSVLAVIGRRVTRVLDAVRDRASDARIALVGYLRIISPTRACPQMPLAAGDRPYLARLERRLDEVLGRAAGAADALFVDMHPVSRGHEVCSADPWVNGQVTDQSRALAYHPFAAGQEAMSRELVRVLESRS